MEGRESVRPVRVGKSLTAAPKRAPRPPGEATGCIHHYLLGTPNGPTSTGTCKKCGHARQFLNAEQEHSWEKTNRMTMPKEGETG